MPGVRRIQRRTSGVKHPRCRNRMPLADGTITTPSACPRYRSVLACAGRYLVREYEADAEALPEAFGLARSSVSRRFVRASANELRRLQERRLDDAEWLVLVLDGKTFAGDRLVIALGVTGYG